LVVKDILNGKNVKTFLDVGANLGNFTKACKQVFSKVKIYCFEPIPELYNKLNNLKDITSFNFGLWSSNKSSMFNYNSSKDAHGTSSFLEYDAENVVKDSLIKKIKVKQVRFDSLNISIERPCFVKIDVEGAEREVLRGFGNKLKEVDVIEIEYNFGNEFKNQTKLSEIFPLLEKYGFKRFLQKMPIYKESALGACELFFFR